MNLNRKVLRSGKMRQNVSGQGKQDKLEWKGGQGRECEMNLHGKIRK